ncbi:probable cytochrome P450 28a5 [Anopheles nili]|uniref:probable cytochrome P450 28a5 n=1 Tax=Anopheles nili TaxID=185578 RepID=UPI00237AF080|nr:probable cytochrome P450 28a5 [Anopheles nili]
MLLFITLLLTALMCIYFYLGRNRNYWTKRGVPGPTPWLLLGNFPSFVLQHRPIVEDFHAIYDKYRSQSNMVGVFNFCQPSLLVMNVAMIKDMLFNNFKHFHDNEFSDTFNKENDPIFGRNPFLLQGDEWKEKRAEITPGFTSSRMKALFPIVEHVSQRMKQYISLNSVECPIETRELCAKYTTDVVSSCIFATDAQSFTNERAEIREMGRKLMEPKFLYIITFLLTLLVPPLKKIIPIRFVPKATEQFFTRLMENAIAYREQNNVKRLDYLDHLISLRDKKHLTSLDMAAHGVTFFIDGFETSSLAMCFALYELARHPEHQKTLRDELIAARNKDGSIDYDVLLELSFLDQVFYETLRLWPPAPYLSKLCTIPTELEVTNGKTVLIERGIPVMVPIWSMHRDEDNFEEPNRFNPDRFAPEVGGTKLYREKGCFLPFGEGPRQCLGMRFALMQVKRGIFEVISKYEISLNCKTMQPLQLDPKAFLITPRGGVWLDFKSI